MAKRLSGVHAPHRKNTAGLPAERMPVPAMLTVPMSMHIGAPSKPIVKPGDRVKVGQKIAEAGGFVSSPVYTGASGTVKKIDNVLVFHGAYVPAVFIETDGEQEISETVAPPEVNDLESFINAVRESGVIGLGGAGFPTAVKLTVKDLSLIETVIINCAECEPYITTDTRTLLDSSDFVMEGVALLKKYLEAKRIVFGVEDNKPECVKKYKELTSGIDGVEVIALPALYPQGGEKVIIYNITGRMVPEGKLPIDVGAIVINCTTLASIAKYIKTGMPYVEKCVTVDGSAVKEPKNVTALIGTPIRELFDFCGGFKTEPKKIICGGPMMGIAAPDLEQPVLKNTGAVLAFDAKDAVLPKTTECIKCGRCIAACPLNLMPADIETAYRLNNGVMLEKLKVNLCMECGCCAFSCPAKRPLVQVNKLAKQTLRAYQEAKKAEAEKAAAKAEEEKTK